MPTSKKPTIKTLTAYLLTPQPESLTFYDILENYCSDHDLLHLTDDVEPEQLKTEHDKLLYVLIHQANNH